MRRHDYSLLLNGRHAFHDALAFLRHCPFVRIALHLLIVFRNDLRCHVMYPAGMRLADLDLYLRREECVPMYAYGHELLLFRYACQPFLVYLLLQLVRRERNQELPVWIVYDQFYICARLSEPCLRSYQMDSFLVALERALYVLFQAAFRLMD